MLLALLLLAVGAVVAVLAFEPARRRQKRRAARWAVSARIGTLLAEGLEEADTVGEALRLLVPGHADWCLLHLVEDRQVRRAAIVHVDPAMEQRMREAFRRVPFVTDAPAGAARVIRTGKPYLFREFLPSMLEKQPDPDLMRAAGLGSCISVPLKARQGIVGVLTLARREKRAYDRQDLSWAQDLAHRIGLAVENRRFFAEARELFEQTVSANFVSTPDGRMLACNQTFATMHGYETIDEALARPTSSFYADPADRQSFLAELGRQKRIVGLELALRHRDGRVIPVSINASGTFDDRGELVKIRGFVIDRSEQGALEEQLRQAQRLEAVGQLAGGIAHDFNNLLTVIIGCSDLLRAERQAQVVDGHDALEELAKAAGRAAVLTRQLLAFSRRQVLQPRVIDLNEAVRGAHTMLRRLLRDNIVLVFDLDPRIDRVRVDSNQLDQVFLNLVVNSADAMPEGGTLTVSTSNLALGEADAGRQPYVTPGQYVSIRVRDTGCGMDESTRARVFEPFFTTKPLGQGTGLGLSTVYGIVKQGGGYVWVTSAPGAGTTVQICLPSVLGD